MLPRFIHSAIPYRLEGIQRGAQDRRREEGTSAGPRPIQPAYGSGNSQEPRWNSFRPPPAATDNLLAPA